MLLGVFTEGVDIFLKPDGVLLVVLFATFEIPLFVLYFSLLFESRDLILFRTAVDEALLFAGKFCEVLLGGIMLVTMAISF